jgi:hypothetical protein
MQQLHGTSSTACSAWSSLSVLGPAPMGTVGDSSVTTSPVFTADTDMLEVKTNEPLRSQESSADLT